MLNEISQRKTNTALFHLYIESKQQTGKTNEQTKENKAHRYREQNGSCHREGGSGMGKINEGDLKVQISSYKANRPGMPNTAW